MSTKCLTWISSSCLPCAFENPAEVFVCVPADKTENGTQHINAILTATTKLCNGQFQYTLCYDDTQIATGQSLLATDVSGVVCADCLTDLIQDLAGFIVTGTNNQDGTVTFELLGGDFTFPAGIGVLGVATGLTATGSTISDAAQLMTLISVVDNVPAGSGVKIRDSAIGVQQIVKNNDLLGVEDLTVYPTSALGVFNTNPAGDPALVSPGRVVFVTKIAADQWIVSQVDPD